MPKPETCVGCPGFEWDGPVWGDGPTPCDLAFMAEAPGAQEVKLGRPMVGGAGQIFHRLLHEVGLRRGEVFVDNVLRCRPPGNKFPAGKAGEKAIAHCRQYDRWLSVQPKVIVALGAQSMKLLTGKKGMDQWRGALLKMSSGS